MITIKSMQVLYRDSSFTQSFITHKTKISLTINGIKTYTSSQSEVKERLSSWNSQAFPLMQVPLGRNSYSMQFVFYKNNTEVGRAKCSALIGRDKKGNRLFYKDCLDVADRSFSIIGKFMYQLIWRSEKPQQQIYGYSPDLFIQQTFHSVNKQNKTSSQAYQNYQSNNPNLYQNQYNPISPHYGQQPYLKQDFSASMQDYRPPNTQQPFFPNAQINQQQSISLTQSQSQIIKPKANKSNSGILGMFGCFSSMRYKQKKPFFVLQPIMMDSGDLAYAGECENEPLSIQYYSKKIS